MDNHILIGIGGTGVRVLKAFRKRLNEEFSPEQRERLPMSFVFVDTYDITKDDGENVFPCEFVNIGVPDGASTGQKRQIGKELFSATVDAYKHVLMERLHKAQNLSATVRTNIYVFAGLAGGTGSGAIVEAIRQTRKMFNYGSTKIFANCILPEKCPRMGYDVGFYYANSYAALAELNDLMIKERDVCDGIYVYSNEMEDGTIVDSVKELPRIVSDITFTNIFMPCTSETSRFKEICLFDPDIWGIQELAPKDNQTKHIVSFGIKRIVYPEREILQYLTCVCGYQALIQLLYNNWQGNGFVKESAKIDFKEIMEDKNLLELWHFTDEYVMLEKPIDFYGKDCLPFELEWQRFNARIKEDARTTADPLLILDESFEHYYGTLFRHYGVKSFFEHEDFEKNVYAKNIVNNIEKYLCEEIVNGRMSLHDACEFTIAFIDYIEVSRRFSLHKRMAEIEVNIPSLNNERNEIRSEYCSAGILHLAIFGKQKYIDRYAEVLTELYAQKTEMESIYYAASLFYGIQHELKNLWSKLDKMIQRVKTDAEAIKAKAEDILPNMSNNLKDFLSYIYNKDAVLAFADNMRRDKQSQSLLCQKVRDAIIAGKKTIEETFYYDINEVVYNTARQEVVNYHDGVCDTEDKKLLHKSLIDVLTERHFVSCEQPICDIMKDCKVLIRHDDTKLWNTSIDASMANKNEMTVMTAACGFPMRAMSCLQFYKEKYDRLVNDPEYGERNRLLLHGAGKGEQLIPLFDNMKYKSN